MRKIETIKKTKDKKSDKDDKRNENNDNDNIVKDNTWARKRLKMAENKINKKREIIKRLNIKHSFNHCFVGIRQEAAQRKTVNQDSLKPSCHGRR